VQQLLGFVVAARVLDRAVPSVANSRLKRASYARRLALNVGQDENMTWDPQDRRSNVVVRRLGSDDVDAFRAVRLAALEDSPDAFGETLEGARAADWHARTIGGATLSDRAVFVAVADDLPVGMVFARCGATPDPAFLGGMWVSPELRRHGIGRSLVQHALAFLRSAGQVEVSLWVTRGHSEVLGFYRSLGFRETGATSSLRPGSDVIIDELRYMFT
jgi:ribosomal protein S18 acetylase RimI-like enzyme